MRRMRRIPMQQTPRRQIVKTIRILPMNRIVPDHQLLLRHPQRHPEHVLDQDQHKRSHDDIEPDDEQRAHNLQPDLSAIVLDRATQTRNTKGRAPFLRGEDTGEESAEEAGDHVGVKDAEGVVHQMEELRLAQLVHRKPRDDAGDDAHADRGPAGNHPRRRRDGHQSRNHALHGANHRRFLEEDDVEDGPGEQAGCGADVGVEHGNARVGAGRVRITPVEAVPAQPEQTGADQDEEHIVRLKVLAVARQPGANPPCPDKTGRPGREMDHVSARVIDHAHLEEKAAAPDAVGARRVAKGDPERDEEDPGQKVHAAEKGTGHDDDGDGGEDKLKVHHGRHGEVGVEVGRR